MTHVLITGTVLGVLAGGLAACATTPDYPIGSPPPTSAADGRVAVPAPAPAPVEAAPATAAPPPSVGEVSSQPLAPVESPPPVAPVISTPAPRRSYTPTPEPSKPEPVHYLATGKVVPAKSMYRDYKVQRGDHLDAIARDLQTTRATLIESNHLKSPDSLRPGQHLRLPIEKAYVVVAGDTIAAIARRFDVSPEDLADLNVLPERQRLRSGELLALPAAIHDHGPVPASSVRLATRYPSTIPYKPIVYPSSGVAQAPLTDGQVMAAGRGRFVWPVRGEILSPFGVEDVGRRNDGVDVKAPEGAEVHAAAAGDVVYAGDQVPGFGNLVLVKHADGWVTAYAHLDKVMVKMREMVEQNQEIGLVGQTGGVSEPELHFEIRYAPNPLDKAKPIDPLLVLPK
jgi:murein DD-endopeptidase MepM/ murein hydrolase activator NlpD